MFHGTSLHLGSANVTGPRSGTLKWRVDVKQGAPGGAGGGSVAVSADGTLYVAGVDKIFALDRSGNQKWAQSYASVQGPAVSRDGSTVYFLSGSSIVALDQSGSLKWKYATGGSVIFGVTVGSDGAVYQGSWDGYVYCLNADGTLRWRFKTDQGCVSYPVTLGSDGIAYVGGGDAHCGTDPNLYAISTAGSLVWKYNTGQQRVGSPTFSPDGLLLAPVSPFLLALSTGGELQWQAGSPQSAVSGVQTPAVGFGRTVYTGHSDGKIRAVSLDTQQTLWSYQTGAAPSDGSFGVIGFPVVDKDDVVYAGSVDYKMYAVDRNGTLVWTYLTGGKLTESSPALDSDGTLYFTSEDGYLYAISGG